MAKRHTPKVLRGVTEGVLQLYYSERRKLRFYDDVRTFAARLNHISPSLANALSFPPPLPPSISLQLIHPHWTGESRAELMPDLLEG